MIPWAVWAKANGPKCSVIDANRIQNIYTEKNPILKPKFGYSEKATKFEKIFHLKFDVTE